MNFGLVTKTFCPDTVTAQTAPVRDPAPGDGPAVLVMPGIPTASAPTAATAASGYEPKSVAGRRGILTSPPLELCGGGAQYPRHCSAPISVDADKSRNSLASR